MLKLYTLKFNIGVPGCESRCLSGFDQGLGSHQASWQKSSAIFDSWLDDSELFLFPMGKGETQKSIYYFEILTLS